MSAIEETNGSRTGILDDAADTAHKDAEALAEALWDQWELTTPVNPVILTDAYHIPVYESRLKPGVMGALVKKDDQYSIYIDKQADLAQKRYTIAHELGHYLLHQDDAPPSGTIIDYRDALSAGQSHPRERQANAFAAALLMDRRALAEMRDGYKNLAVLAQHFGAPLETVKYRLDALETRP